MNAPTTPEVLQHLAEHYGLTTEGAWALCRIPIHPATLRDEFAGRALPELIRQGDKYKDIANHAYGIADAMQEARNANR